ncbi:MAG: hypothetical protein HQK72_15010 [Desulfamplus sp.]|nr:hypothetical protein [Desulfamplus sp.]
MGEKEAPANKFALMMIEHGLTVESHSICEQCKQHVLNDIMSYADKGGFYDDK